MPIIRRFLCREVRRIKDVCSVHGGMPWHELSGHEGIVVEKYHLLIVSVAEVVSKLFQPHLVCQEVLVCFQGFGRRSGGCETCASGCQFSALRAPTSTTQTPPSSPTRVFSTPILSTYFATDTRKRKLYSRIFGVSCNKPYSQFLEKEWWLAALLRWRCASCSESESSIFPA